MRVWDTAAMTDRRLRSIGRRLVVDVTPLRQSPAYRLLYLGSLTAHLGRQLTVVAVPFQIYAITGSTLAVGLLGIAQFVPLLAASLVGGAVADAVDRRKLLAVSQIVLAATAAGLAWNAAVDDPRVWPLYVLSGLNAAVSAVDSPTRSAVLPALVGRSLLPSALALNQTLANVARAVGPAVGGVLIATMGLTSTFAIECGLFIISGVVLTRMPALVPEGGGTKFGWRSIAEGLTFVKQRRLLQASFLIDINAMVFGMPQALFPAIGSEMFGGNASTVGLLYAAPGVGAMLAAATSGWVGMVRRHGRAVIVSVIVWGVSIATFGLVGSLPLALGLLALAGAADVVSAVFRNTILQMAVPDSLRGRLSSIHLAVVAGGPRLGDVESGLVAALASVRFSVVSGGVACVIGALAIARWMPELRNYSTDESGAEVNP